MTYLDFTNQFEEGYTSEGLKEFSAYYSNRLSYEDVEELVERTSGEKQLSDQSIQTTVVNKALELSEKIYIEASKVLEDNSLDFPAINQEVDIYDVDTKEVLIFVDGIFVKKQSESRISKKKKAAIEATATEATVESKSEPKKTVRINTNVVLVEKKSGGFEYITSAIDEKGEERLPISDIVKSKVIQEYGNDEEPINVLVISDGAKDIRSMLMEVFGVLIVIILDWYHLCKKVREFMSMIARNKKEKAEHLEFLLYHLWHGRTKEVLDYLKNKVKAKNEEKLQGLIGYIEKHQEEIIDYDRRKKAGKEVASKPEQEEGVHNQSAENGAKKVGSERVKKACDSVVGNCLEQFDISLNQEREDFDSGVQNKSSSNVKAVKKVVGSGRVEKACDNVIGKRQKRKAMSWSKLGNRSLAILKVVELNNKWFDIWVPKTASNDLQEAANDPCESAELGIAA